MSTPVKSRQITITITTALAWLLAVVLGLAAIYATYQLSLAVFATATRQDPSTTGQFYTGVLTGQLTALFAGGLWLVAVIWSGEYALKHAGERRVWKIFAWMLGIEVLLILVAWFLNLL